VNFKEAVMLLVKSHANKHKLKFSKADRLSFTVAVHFPDKRRADIANREKLLTDAVCSALGIDDEQIDRLLMIRGEISKILPRCQIELETITPLRSL
jgi:Holliday junction resolvase RusA-like endonuclease